MPLCSRRIRAVEELILAVTKGICRVQLSHAGAVRSARFDEQNLVSAGGLVPVLGLADRVGLRRLVDERLTVPTDKGAHAGAKVAALVAGMVAGADSIEDMGLLRHGGMGRLFVGTYAPSTLGSFLRCFAFGHVRQLDAVAARLVANLAARAPVLPGTGEVAYLDVDDTVRATYGYANRMSTTPTNWGGGAARSGRMVVADLAVAIAEGATGRRRAEIKTGNSARGAGAGATPTSDSRHGRAHGASKHSDWTRSGWTGAQESSLAVSSACPAAGSAVGLTVASFGGLGSSPTFAPFAG